MNASGSCDYCLCLSAYLICAYLFLIFSDLTCLLEDTGIGVFYVVFFGCTVPSDSKETEIKSSSQEAFQSAGENTGVVLILCCTWKCAPTAISSCVDISEVSGCTFF